MLYKLSVLTYCKLHQIAKRILGHRVDLEFRSCKETFNNKSLYYPVENLIEDDENLHFPLSYVKSLYLKHSFCKSIEEASALWKTFINQSVISDGYKNAGFHYAGYLWDCDSWCLPSWIWTNAALVRCFVSIGDTKDAMSLCDRLIARQHDCGGWIVRDDYSKQGVIHQLAPNDSAYIANNACITVYKATKEEKYLLSAIKCADWIIKTARPDGIVYLGFDIERNQWIKDNNIVDIGFTAGLFAELYAITKDEKYREFLKKFCGKYIQLFYNTSKKRFFTGIINDKPVKGAFGRGQAWALEGLIPAYETLGDTTIRQVIQDTVDTLITNQHKKGGWAYNLDKPLMGEDCKGISVIALSLFKWYKITNDRRLLPVIKKALEWCARHTQNTGKATGGIFSFCLEGAVVHHLYTNTAFVYASSYALELIRNYEKEK